MAAALPCILQWPCKRGGKEAKDERGGRRRPRRGAVFAFRQPGGTTENGPGGCLRLGDALQWLRSPTSQAQERAFCPETGLGHGPPGGRREKRRTRRPGGRQKVAPPGRVGKGGTRRSRGKRRRTGGKGGKAGPSRSLPPQGEATRAYCTYPSEGSRGNHFPWRGPGPVSYTHLDVYKRQPFSLLRHSCKNAQAF